MTWKLLVICLYLGVGNACAQIQGTVFRDFNANGIYEATPVSGTFTYGEPRVSGIVVTAFNAANTAVSSVTTTGTSPYTLTTGITNGTAYRIEFTNVGGGDFSGALGANSGSSVQFVTAGPAATAINFGINYPADYCQANPDMVTNCYVFGDQVNGFRKNEHVFVRFPYSSSGTTPPTSLADAINIGTTFGIAYQKDAKTIYASAFHKVSAGHGPGGPGAIYKSVNGGAFTVFADLGALTGPNPRTAYAPNTSDTNGGDWRTDATWDLVGKVSFGDMDISDDGQTLYVVNLNDRKLYIIPVANPAAFSSVNIPLGPDPAKAADVRPFALKYYRGKVYVGMVRSAESTSLVSDLVAYVYSFDGTTFGAAPVLSFPLNYTRGQVFGGPTSANWRPWVTTRTSVRNSNLEAFPQPMFGDIEFDVDGSMIIGLRDRFGDQSQSDPTNNIYGSAAGDLLRAGRCNSLVELWTIESNAGVCGGTPTSGAGNNQGPGGGEFYSEDNWIDLHTEVALGALALLPGSGQVASTVYDPFRTDGSAFFAGGLRWFNNTTGIDQREYQLFDKTMTQFTFAKASGLGDLELLCNPAPIEIGNRVWNDGNSDGIQNANEAVYTPVAGLTVQLLQGGTVIATVPVSASGTYLFSSVSTTVIQANTAYQVRLVLPANNSLGISPLRTGPNSTVDSDASVAGVVSLTTSGFGTNNHTFDIGVVSCTGVTATVGSQTICSGTSATLTANASGGSGFTYVWAPAGTGTSASVVVSPATTTTYSVTATNSAGCSATATATVTVNPAVTAVVTASPGSTICQGRSVTLTASGGATYRWSTGATSTTITATPASTTAFSVTVTNASGCSAVTTATITVNPAVTVAVGSQTICSGTSATLTANASGGSGFTYVWAPAGTGTSASVTVSPATTTIYSVTATNSAGCSATATATVTVNPAVTGTASVTGATCFNNVPQANARIAVTGIANGVRASISVGSSYTGAGFTDPNGVAVTSSAVSFSGLAANQTYTVRVFSAGGACLRDFTVSVAQPVCCSLTFSDVSAGPCSTTTNQYITTGTVNLGNSVSGNLIISNGSHTISIPVLTTTTSVTFALTDESDGATNTLSASLVNCGSISTPVVAPVACYSACASGCLPLYTQVYGTGQLPAGEFAFTNVNAQARIGSGSVGGNTYETAFTRANGVLAQGEFNWGNGQPNSFTLTYDPTATNPANKLIYRVASSTLTVSVSADPQQPVTGTAPAPVNYNALQFFVSANSNATSQYQTKLENLTFNGTALGQSISTPTGSTSAQNQTLILRTNTPNQPFTVTGTVTMSWSTSINPTQSTLNATIGYGVASVCGVPPVTTVNSGTLTCQSSGSATTLTATSSGGTTFRWTGPANFTANTASITATSPGTYTVVSTNAQTGCSSTTTATVVQDPGVVVNLFSQSNCLNNGTDATTTDDFFTVSIQATTNTPGPAGRYEVVLGADANGLGGTVLNPGAPGGTPYGSTVTVGGAGQPNANGFLANGTSIYSLTIRDSANNNGNAGCRTTRLTGQVLPCSSCLPDPCQPVQLRKQ